MIRSILRALTRLDDHWMGDLLGVASLAVLLFAFMLLTGALE